MREYRAIQVGIKVARDNKMYIWKPARGGAGGARTLTEIFSLIRYTFQWAAVNIKPMEKR